MWAISSCIFNLPQENKARGEIEKLLKKNNTVHPKVSCFVFAVQALFYGLAWAAWVCTIFYMNFRTRTNYLELCSTKKSDLFESLQLVIDVIALSQVAYLAASFKVIYVLARPAVSINKKKMNSCNHFNSNNMNWLICSFLLSYRFMQLSPKLQAQAIRLEYSCAFYCHIWFLVLFRIFYYFRNISIWYFLFLI